ncbi:LysM peptidoglycan-binding domain-containing protein [Thiohalophilus thiocyanatoxydans]|uniref:LysM domain-containing protein n=1 Tax=Thiohalophilus thiocyanatoxydans TaxID=381308 RepID=A0A4V6QBY9_9GAMM|nr:LysM peptidoglycan-binding domain-containing protein [Thiohalophilus thiocyanatoxydans]TDY03695.1 LysM domain-containing protein [Thiohalophilus thiocyanatoxydans]
MVDNKPTGPILTRFLSIVLLGMGLAACGSAPPEREPASAPESTSYTIDEAPDAEPQKPVFKPDYPERYVVKRGDTLWDIAGRFLKDPWLWPKVWHINPEIRNPHLIYPGDVIVLYHGADGEPYLTLEGSGGVTEPRDREATRLSPRERYEPIDKAIPTIPRSVIAPFLQRPRVIGKDELDDAPYIVSSYEGHLISSNDNTIYVRDIEDEAIGRYEVVRPGRVYKDPETGETLGYEVLRLAEARVTRGKTGVDDVTTLNIERARQEVLNGDHLLPAEEETLEFNFFPRPPEEEVNGHIIAVHNGLSQIGQHNVVILSRGARDGLESGHVLAIYQDGGTARDPVNRGSVELPDERAGLLMVFRTYEKVSYALVMEANRALHVKDRVTSP